MKTVLVTGSNGFVGKHLVEALRRRDGTRVVQYDLGSPLEDLERGLAEAELIFHLAGVNRPKDVAEFQTGNTGFTEQMCQRLTTLRRAPMIVMSSSTQAALDNPYGKSKRAAEETLERYSRHTGAEVIVHRLKNLFGKWCRPNYNSVTATFCHNIAHDLPIQISNLANIVDLTYIDDVITAFLAVLDTPTHRRTDAPSLTPDSRPPTPGFLYAPALTSRQITLGELSTLIHSFRNHRKTLLLPDYSDPFVRALYATYLSYLDGPDFAYQLDIKTDPRGSLAEFLKSPPFGQVFVSRTKPGITRGNHYHHTKTEKFLVVEGEALIRFRSIQPEIRDQRSEISNVPPDLRPPTSDLSPSNVIEHRVTGKDFRVLDIPPGYTHSIENVGNTEMVVLFWASEVFDPAKPDTFAAPVLV